MCNIVNLFAHVVLRLDGLPLKTKGDLFYVISSFVHHFEAIHENHSFFGFCDIEIW